MRTSWLHLNSPASLVRKRRGTSVHRATPPQTVQTVCEKNVLSNPTLTDAHRAKKEHFSHASGAKAKVHFQQLREHRVLLDGREGGVQENTIPTKIRHSAIHELTCAQRHKISRNVAVHTHENEGVVSSRPTNAEYSVCTDRRPTHHFSTGESPHTREKVLMDFRRHATQAGHKQSQLAHLFRFR